MAARFSAVAWWGMGEKVGFVYLGEPEGQGFLDLAAREYSDKTAETIDAEVKRILDTAYEHATRTINENRDKVVGLRFTYEPKLLRFFQARFEPVRGSKVLAD